MAEPTAMILRFNGDPDDLLERFEKARRLWVQAHDSCEPPVFYAACRTKRGLVAVIAWANDEAHKEFARTVRQYMASAGMNRPDEHEHLTMTKLGWS